MNYPKEAWYDGGIATQVKDNVYYRYRGCWSDPVYVWATSVENIPIFGAEIEGKEVNYWDAMEYLTEEQPDDYEPTADEIVDYVEDIVLCMEGKL